MGKFGIGARVRDDGGDEGVIVEKAKGARLVEYDYAAYGKLWQSKASLTALPCAETSENAYLTDGDTENKWVPKVGDRVRNLSESAYDSFPVGGTGTVVGPIGRGGIWASSDIDGWNGFFLYSEVEPVVAPATTWTPAVGDKVRVIDPTLLRDDTPIGAEGVVTRVYADGEHFEIDLNHPRDGVIKQYVRAKDVELAPPLTIEAGKFYRTRDGRKVGPAQVGGPFNVGSDEYGRKAFAYIPGQGDYTVDGIWLSGNGNEDPDLVAEWVEPAVVAVAEATATPVEPAPKFKAGQKVRCINSSWGTAYQAGKIYEVREARVGHISTVLDSVGSTTNGWSDHNFEAIDEPATPPAKFKVGDRVRVLRNRNAYGDEVKAIPIGTVVTLTDEVQLEESEREGWAGWGTAETSYWVRSDDVELVSSAPAIGSTVTFTATGRLSAINDNGHMQVTFPGLPAGRNSFALPAEYVGLAN